MTRTNQALQSLSPLQDLSPDENSQVVEHDSHPDLFKISLETFGLKI